MITIHVILASNFFPLFFSCSCKLALKCPIDIKAFGRRNLKATLHLFNYFVHQFSWPEVLISLLPCTKAHRKLRIILNNFSSWRVTKIYFKINLISSPPFLRICNILLIHPPFPSPPPSIFHSSLIVSPIYSASYMFVPRDTVFADVIS